MCVTRNGFSFDEEMHSSSPSFHVKRCGQNETEESSIIVMVIRESESSHFVSSYFSVSSKE